VTKGTKAGTQPASIAYMSHVLDAVEVSIRALRTTRIHAMTHTVDAKLAATPDSCHLGADHRLGRRFRWSGAWPWPE
jgi:hypothetical protein